jgi:hypothetical protein
VAIDSPVATYLTDRVALGTTAPAGSVMTPESVAPATCARTGTETRSNSPSIPAPRTSPAAVGCIRVPSPNVADPVHCLLPGYATEVANAYVIGSRPTGRLDTEPEASRVSEAHNGARQWVGVNPTAASKFT